MPLFPALLDPLGKLGPLPSNINETRPGLEHLEGVADVVAVDLAVGAGESGGAFALNLARPHAPLDRPQRRRSEDQTQARDEQRDDGLDGDVERERLCHRSARDRG